MLKVNAAWFVQVLNTLSFCEGALKVGAGISEPTASRAVAQCRDLIKHLPAADAPATISALQRVISAWTGSEGGVSKERLNVLLDNVMSNMTAELTGRSLWLMSSSEQAIHNRRTAPFGTQVFEAFPANREDLEEATLSLALGRYVACVFHLMRAMERCVGEISHNLSGVRKETVWGELLSDIKAAISGMPKGSQKTAWSHAHSLLFTVKEAWRNEVMHPKQTYTQQQAQEVFDATGSFMRCLARLLHPASGEDLRNVTR
jgi:HEPN domain-containing protein